MNANPHATGDGRDPVHGDSEPAWLDLDEYPFAPHWFSTPSGTMHYVDEGRGRPVVFVHGNPTWSFQFRHVIKDLATSRRCIAPDHLGFGLSDKPPAFSYLPVDQAANFAGQLNPRGPPQSEKLRVVRNPSYPQASGSIFLKPTTRLVEEDIARVCKATDHIQPPVTTEVPAVERLRPARIVRVILVRYLHPSQALKLRSGCQHTLLQCPAGDDDLVD